MLVIIARKRFHRDSLAVHAELRVQPEVQQFPLVNPIAVALQCICLLSVCVWPCKTAREKCIGASKCDTDDDLEGDAVKSASDRT